MNAMGVLRRVCRYFQRKQQVQVVQQSQIPQKPRVDESKRNFVLGGVVVAADVVLKGGLLAAVVKFCYGCEKTSKVKDLDTATYVSLTSSEIIAALVLYANSPEMGFCNFHGILNNVDFGRADDKKNQKMYRLANALATFIIKIKYSSNRVLTGKDKEIQDALRITNINDCITKLTKHLVEVLDANEPLYAALNRTQREIFNLACGRKGGTLEDLKQGKLQIKNFPEPIVLPLTKAEFLALILGGKPVEPRPGAPSKPQPQPPKYEPPSYNPPVEPREPRRSRRPRKPRESRKPRKPREPMKPDPMKPRKPPKKPVPL